MPFVKGDPNINRKGRPVNPEIQMLRDALAAEGIKRGYSFWQKVAEQAFIDHQIMASVLRKFVPDTAVTTLEGDIPNGPTQILVIASKKTDGNTPQAVPREVPVEQ